MEKILYNTIDRIKEVIDYKKLSVRKFSSSIGISHSLIGKIKSIGSDKLETILSVYSDIDAEWLLTGKGHWKKELDSFNPLTDQQVSAISLVTYNTIIKGFENKSFTIHKKDIITFYIIPKFSHKKIDFMIEVEGSSMYPKYSSGDLVACMILSVHSFIQWNKVYVIVTKEQGVIIKRIIKSTKEGCLTMVSDNKNYDTFDVPLKGIIGIALVAGVIRIE
jgi:hypothetical protein